MSVSIDPELKRRMHAYLEGLAASCVTPWLFVGQQVVVMRYKDLSSLQETEVTAVDYSNDICYVDCLIEAIHRSGKQKDRSVTGSYRVFPATYQLSQFVLSLGVQSVMRCLGQDDFLQLEMRILNESLLAFFHPWDEKAYYASAKAMAGDSQTPMQPCPWCGEACAADWVDIGVGYEQTGPYHCVKCDASQMGPELRKEGFKRPEGSRAGWYPPGHQASPYANTVQGRIVSNYAARIAYELGVLDNKERK